MALTAHHKTLSPPPPSLVYGWKNATPCRLLLLPLIIESEIELKIKATAPEIRHHTTTSFAIDLLFFLLSVDQTIEDVEKWEEIVLRLDTELFTEP